MAAGLSCLVYTTGTEDASIKVDSVASFDPEAVSTHAKWWARSSETMGFRYMLTPQFMGGMNAVMPLKSRGKKTEFG